MTFKETVTALGKIKALFPQSKLGEKEEDLNIIAGFWHDALKDIPNEVVEKALKAYCLSNTSGFAPQIGNLMDIIRQKSSGRLDSVQITRLLKRALSNSAYNSKAEFGRLPDDLKRVVGNAGELYFQSQRDTADTEIYIKTVIKDYRARVDNGTLDNTLLLPEGSLKQLRAMLDEG